MATGGGLVLAEGSARGLAELAGSRHFRLSARGGRARSDAVEHVRLDGAKGTVHVRWPGPKTDTTGIGCMRSWACLCCGSGRRPDGPYHRAQAQLHLLGDLFCDPLPAEMPFFSNKEGCTVAEAQLVAALDVTAKAMGQEIVNENGTRYFGGHSFRVVGARRLGSLGVEVARIIVLARELQDKIGDPRTRSATPGRAVQKVISPAVEALRAECSPTLAGQVVAKSAGRKRGARAASDRRQKGGRTPFIARTKNLGPEA